MNINYWTTIYISYTLHIYKLYLAIFTFFYVQDFNCVFQAKSLGNIKLQPVQRGGENLKIVFQNRIHPVWFFSIKDRERNNLDSLINDGLFIYIIKKDIRIDVPYSRPNGWTECAESF